MRPYLVVALGCMMTAPLSSGSAQGQPSQPKNWSFSLGVDSKQIGHNETLYSDDALVVASLTRTWQSTESRFARHVSLLAGSDIPYRIAETANDGCGGCGAPFTRRYMALTAGVSYDLFRVSRFTPYVTAGTGAYYTKMNRNLDESRISLDPRLFRTGFSLGAKAGFGIKARFGSRELFVEQMMHATDVGRPSLGFRPLSLGIRF